MRALVVEDDPTSRQALLHVLESVGFKVDAAASVAEAMKLLRPPPDVLILDLLLPDGSGIEVLRHVRSAALPTIVALASGAPDATLVETRSLWPDSLFVKPLELADLRRWLEGVTGRLAEVQEMRQRKLEEQAGQAEGETDCP